MKLTPTRKQVLGIVAMVFAAMVLSAFTLALSPLWLPALLIRPGLAAPIAETSVSYIMSRTMHAAMGGVKSAR